MVIVTLEDFNPECKVDVEVKQYVPPPKLDEDGNLIEKLSGNPNGKYIFMADSKKPDGSPFCLAKGLPDKPDAKPDAKLSESAHVLAQDEEEPNIKVNLTALKWADEIKVHLFGEGHILRTRDLLEHQLLAYDQWLDRPATPIPPKDPQEYIQRLQQLQDLEQEVQRRVQEVFVEDGKAVTPSLLEKQHRQFLSFQDTDEYEKYKFLQEQYLESLKPPPPPRDWSQKEYPELLELQNEQFLLWYKANRAYLESLLKPEEPIEDIPPPPPTLPRPSKDINIYLENLQKMQEVAEYWRERGPYIYWPDEYDPKTYFLELQRRWMREWEYTEEYIRLCRGVIRKKVKKLKWRAMKWWEWKPSSNLFKEEREPTKPLDYAGLPRLALSGEYRKQAAGKLDGEVEVEEAVDPEAVMSHEVIKWDIVTKKPFKSMEYTRELAAEVEKMPENCIFWDKEPRPLDMQAIYKETYEVIVKTQPNFI